MARPEVTGRANSARRAAIATPTIKLMSKPEVLDLIGVTYTTLYNWMKRGQFPLARELGPAGGNTIKLAWFESEVMAWLANRPQRQLGKSGD